MALFARVDALFRRAPLSRPRRHNINPHPQEENMECGDDWQYVSREEIADASRQRAAFLYKQLDAENAVALNVQRQNPIPFAFDIGVSEVDGYLMLDTPHQKALNFGKLLDAFNSNSNADEESFTF